MDGRVVRVLLADDNETGYQTMHGWLTEIEARRFNLEWVTTIESARERIACRQHELYFIDHQLGEREGLTLLREAVSNGCKAPMILLTESEEREIEVEAMKAGAADCLVKGRINVHLLRRSIQYSLEHARTLAALHESEERYALTARGAKDGLWDWNLVTNALYVSPRGKSFLGCEENEMGSNPEEWRHRVHPEDLDRVKKDLAAHLSGQTPHFESELRLLHKDGGYRWMHLRGLAIRNADGKPIRIAGSQTDLTERKRIVTRLARRALYDPLTNLPNRALFINRLRHAIGHTRRRKNYLFAVFFLDLDRFKVVNDSFGHIAGDQLLMMTARRLEACLRPGDTVARLGGDEFTVFLDDINGIHDAVLVAERILKELSLPFNLNGQEVYCNTSIGIALSATGYDKPEDILRDADTALYLAKKRGGGAHQVFGTVTSASHATPMQLETDFVSHHRDSGAAVTL